MDGDAASPQSPFLFSNSIYSWLDAALDMGIEEKDFWDMTFAEIERKLDSYRRVQKQKKQEKASFDYILAELIGRSVARVYHSNNTMPDIATAYPTLFNSKEVEEQKQNRKDELSALRFKQFAQSFNSKFKQEVAKDNGQAT